MKRFGVVLQRAFLALLLGVATAALNQLSYETQSTALLSLFVAGIFAGGMLFGAVGVVVVAAVQVASLVSLEGLTLPESLTHSVASVLPGAIGWLAFHWTPGVGRALPNLRSFLVFSASGAVGSLLGAIVVARAFFGGAFWVGTYWWAGSALATILMFVPLVLVFCRTSAVSWIAEIPVRSCRKDRRPDPSKLAACPTRGPRAAGSY